MSMVENTQQNIEPVGLAVIAATVVVAMAILTAFTYKLLHIAANSVA